MARGIRCLKVTGETAAGVCLQEYGRVCARKPAFFFLLFKIKSHARSFDEPLLPFCLIVRKKTVWTLKLVGLNVTPQVLRIRGGTRVSETQGGETEQVLITRSLFPEEETRNK